MKDETEGFRPMATSFQLVEYAPGHGQVENVPPLGETEPISVATTARKDA